MRIILFILFFSVSFLFSQEDIEVVANLPNEVAETSGLIFYNGKLITLNDSGNEAKLYEIDTVSYEISRTVTLSNAVNIDWEALTQDDKYIYIGDFGNNIGARTDLRILKIKKEEYDQSDSISAEIISFVYEDQTDFSNTGNSDWDAETFFVRNDQLIILTKQWQSEGTVAYALPTTVGDHVAQRIDSYDIQGLVTDATYNAVSKELFIIGYSSTLAPFIVVVEDDANAAVFGAAITRTNLSIAIAQVEAIAHTDEQHYFFTSEFFMRSDPDITLASQLFRFEVDEEGPEPGPEPEPGPNPEPEPEENGEIVLFQRRGYQLVEYNLNTTQHLLGRTVFDSMGRQVLKAIATDLDTNSVDISSLQSSLYYLTFYFNDRVVSLPFFNR